MRLTNPDRVLFPEQGLTKLDLALYYDQVADWMLPHVADRPLTIVRCPEGREKPCFYQKHVGLGVPEAIDSIEIRETGGKTGSYLVVRDREGLVSLVQMGVLETHPWGSRTDDIEKPDRLIFDLDPDVGLPWLRVVEGALLVRELLEDLELVSWVKTTGGKGLHVVVPITRRWDWDLVKEFCQAVTRKVVADAPDRYTGVASKARRKNKVYVDYLRNARGATSIAPYSTRALRGAPVATPLSWDELSEGLPKFDIGSIPARLSGRRVDPWADFPKKKQSITQAMIRKLASG